MTRRLVLTFTFAALAALLAALLLRRQNAAAVAPTPGETASLEEPEAVPRETVVAVSIPAAPLPRTTPVNLHGLRLLPEQLARERGWAPKPIDPMIAVWRRIADKLRATELSLSYLDTSFEDLVADLRTRYSLEIRIDPKLSVENKTVTFRVDELAADQAIDLILKMADLAYRVDEHGIIWIVSKESLEENNPVWQEVYNVQENLKPRKTNAERIAEWTAGRTSTVAIVSQPVDEAVLELLENATMKNGGWSQEAELLAQQAPKVSLLGTDLPVGKALEDLLKPLGVTLSCNGEDVYFATQEEHDSDMTEEWKVLRVRAEDERLTVSIGKRRVRIDGDLLKLADVAKQLSSQLGETVRIDPHYDDSVLRWEADDKDQSVEEVLAILERDARLSWGYTTPLSIENESVTRRQLWLLKRD